MNTPEPCGWYDPCVYILYQDLQEGFFYAMFDNGLISEMPYKKDEDGNNVIEWEAVPIFYMRN